MIDTVWDSNGPLVVPKDYPKALCAEVRARGGLIIVDEVQDLSNQQLELANISQRLAGQIQYLDNLIDSLIKDKFTRQEQQTKIRDRFEAINSQLKALQAKPTPPEATDETQTD